MAWFYAVLFMIGNVMLIIGTGLLLVVLAKLSEVEKILAAREARTLKELDQRFRHAEQMRRVVDHVRGQHDKGIMTIRNYGQTSEEALADARGVHDRVMGTPLRPWIEDESEDGS